MSKSWGRVESYEVEGVTSNVIVGSGPGVREFTLARWQ